MSTGLSAFPGACARGAQSSSPARSRAVSARVSRRRSRPCSVPCSRRRACTASAWAGLSESGSARKSRSSGSKRPVRAITSSWVSTGRVRCRRVQAGAYSAACSTISHARAQLSGRSRCRSARNSCRRAATASSSSAAAGAPSSSGEGLAEERGNGHQLMPASLGFAGCAEVSRVRFCPASRFGGTRCGWYSRSLLDSGLRPPTGCGAAW